MKSSLLDLVEKLHNSKLVPGTVKLSFIYFGSDDNVHVSIIFNYDAVFRWVSPENRHFKKIIIFDFFSSTNVEIDNVKTLVLL